MPQELSQKRTYALRPLTTAELADIGFTLYRDYFPALFLLSLLSQIPAAVLDLGGRVFGLDPQVIGLALGASPNWQNLLIYLLWFGLTYITALFAAFFQYMMIESISKYYLCQKLTYRDLLQNALSRWRAITWTFLLECTLIILPIVFFTVAVVLATLLSVEAFPHSLYLAYGVGLITFLLALAPSLWVFIRLLLVPQAMTLESICGWTAIQRSFQIVGYNPGLGFWYWGEMRLSILLLPIFIVQSLLNLLTAAPLIIYMICEHLVANVLTHPNNFLTSFSHLLTHLVVALILPLYLIAQTLYYYEVRIRREGFDLKFMTERTS